MGFKSYMSIYAASGSLVSSRKDANTPVGTSPTWNTIFWNASVPVGTTLKFQVAASDSALGTFTFVGPDGTGSTYFSNGASLAQFNGKQYLHYQALFTGNGVATPVLNDVTICFNSARPGVDLDADARGDVFTYSSASGDWKRQLALADGTFLESSGSWDPDWTVVPAKFNQDRLTDLFLFNTTSGQWYRMVNDGTGFTTQATDFWWPGWQRVIMDLDGDGISDLFLYDPISGVWFKAVSTPTDVTYSQGG